jgi:hypothetical protein
MPRRIRVRIGDVFLVPVSEDQQAYGQVIDQDDVQLLVVLFRSTAGSVHDVVRSGFQLAGIVFDGKFRNGDWPIVDNLLPVEFSQPWFVEGHEGLGNLAVVSFDSSARRQVTPAQASRHGHRNLSYPMVLQMAAQAEYGHGEWRPDYNHLRHLASELSGA